MDWQTQAQSLDKGEETVSNAIKWHTGSRVEDHLALSMEYRNVHEHSGPWIPCVAQQVSIFQYIEIPFSTDLLLEVRCARPDETSCRSIKFRIRGFNRSVRLTSVNLGCQTTTRINLNFPSSQVYRCVSLRKHDIVPTRLVKPRKSLIIFDERMGGCFAIFKIKNSRRLKKYIVSNYINF